MPRLFAGTSGFAYNSWKPGFYPPKLPAKEYLRHYAQRLNSTEVNFTFRQLAKSTTLANWSAATSEDFIFAVKAHMRLTHILKLKNTASFLEVFLQSIDALRVVRKLGPILFQLPPTLKCDIALLADFLALLPPDLLYTFEFRHSSWLTSEVYDVLAARKIALCLAESDKLVVPEVVTAPFLYMRLRKQDYSPEERTAIADRAARLLGDGTDLYVYFKHEDDPAGAIYAEELLRIAIAASSSPEP
jgi:uncharacterized protein YecE (DUF72 family)